MERHAFLLIEGDEPAMKLALAWPNLDHEGFDGEEVEEIFEAWSDAAGVAYLETIRCAPILFSHAICLPDGTLDEIAAQMIQAKLAVRMRAARRRPTTRQT